MGGLFELEFTGEHELKGFARPMLAWRVVGEAAVESRFAASRAGRHLPMVGRAHEMGLMLDRWRLARGGEGQIVTVIGEAGIGKSRAIEALGAALVGEPHARIHLQGSPYYSDSALFPVIKHVSRAAHFAAADSSPCGSRSCAPCSRRAWRRTRRRCRCWRSCCRFRWMDSRRCRR